MFGLYVIAFLGFIICPISIVIFSVGFVLDRTAFKEYRRIGSIAVSILAVISLAMGFMLHSQIIPLETVKCLVSKINILGIEADEVSIMRYVISDLRTIGFTLLIEELCFCLATLTPEKMMLDAEKRDEMKKKRIVPINYIPRRSQMVFGVSGAGKSAFIAKSIDEILSDNPDAFCAVVDGKGSTEMYSLYYSMKIIAKKYNKKVYVINGTANDSLNMCTYDFLEGVEKPDAAKDLIMTLIDDPTIKASAGSEHYKTMTESYIMQIIDFMMKHEIDVTLWNALQMFEPDRLEAILSQMNVNPIESEEIIAFAKRNWPEVSASVTKLKMFLKGQGSELFASERERFNLRRAYTEKALVIVLADAMSMPSLAEKLVQLTAMDLRNLVAERLTNKLDMERKVYAYFDEFTSFTSSLPLLKDLYARARSADVVMTLATQSCSDIIGLGSGWFDSLCDTADRFVIFRQHSGQASEAAAGLFGTELHLTQTSRSSDLVLTGESSNTVDRKYKVHPDTIRTLENNRGIMLDKQSNSISYFKNIFLEGEK